MAKFIYSAVREDGRKARGFLEADNEEAFRLEAKRQGLYLIHFDEKSEGGGGRELTTTIKVRELSVLCRQFGTMLNAGIGVVKCLDVLQEQTGNARVRGILRAVMEDVRKGRSLHQAMARQGRAFPFYLVSSVESGEESGTLDGVMERMADYFDNQYKIQAKVRSALIYPIILAVLCVGMVALMLIFVVPRFLAMYSASGQALPMVTQILLSISSFITGKWWLVLVFVAAVGALVLLIKSIPVTRVLWDDLGLRIPILGKMRRTLVTAKFAHTLSTLTSSGISILVSLEVVARVINNSRVTQIIGIIIDDLKRGVPLSESLKQFDIFPQMFKSMIAVGEESGELDSLLIKTANFYDGEADVAIRKMVSLVEPLMIIFMAFIIGFIVVSVILPIYGMYQNIM